MARQNVSRWHAQWRAGGPDALASRGPTGPDRRLSDQQLHDLDTTLRQGARAIGFDTDHWTLVRITTVIQQRTRHRYHPGHTWKRRRGLLAHGEPLREPASTGIELAGAIDAVAPDTPGWRVGQDVLGQVPTGAAATHILAAPENLLAKPDWLAFEQAAALPVAAETAVRTLRQLAVHAGQTLLVHAVAGGVGVLAAQLARAWGARVIGTASPSHHVVLRELGVEPVAYGDGLAERVRAAAPGGIDAVLDASGRGVLAVSIELAGGPDKVITIADPQAARYGVRFSTGTQGVSLQEVFAQVFPLVERGALHMPIERIFPLERAADAHRLSEDGHLLGKIVVAVA